MDNLLSDVQCGAGDHDDMVIEVAIVLTRGRPQQRVLSALEVNAT
jgi:hypothetical protein